MSQIARPNSTIDSAGWAVIGAPTHHEAVDDEIRDDDASYIKCVEGNGLIKLGLSEVEEPRVRSSPDHIFTMWARAIGSGKGESLDGWLYQGETLIKQLYSKKAMPRIDYSFDIRSVLGGEEAELITDYSALEVHFAYNIIGAGEEIRITLMELEVPDPKTYKGPVMMII